MRGDSGATLMVLLGLWRPAGAISSRSGGAAVLLADDHPWDQPAALDAQANTTAIRAITRDDVAPPPAVIVMTPAGRRDRMQLLVLHLTVHHTAGSVDAWYLWDNTREDADSMYLRSLDASHTWIHRMPFPSACNAGDDRALRGNNQGVICFWRDAAVQKLAFANTVIRLDDDIVWLDSPDALRSWVAFTRDRPYVTYANVLNNQMSEFFLQTECHKLLELPLVKRNCTGMDSWSNGSHAVALHRAVLAQGPRSLRCSRTIELHAERYSINAVAWHGPHLARLRPGALPHNLRGDDEEDLSVHIPKQMGLNTSWFGEFVAAHFSFFTQDEAVVAASDVFEGYKALAPHT